ncbi:MAG: hypothetical protein IJR34_08010 [Bacteroidales bacterium]|nr:hypothetical protein [Bacteroidales bacterium]
MAILKKIILWVCIIAVLIGAGAFFFHFYFVFGEGTKAGELNFVVKKGVIFKTYEGRLIQTGLTSKGAVTSPGSGLQSNEFNFSIDNKEVAELLMRKSGCFVQLHYREFRGKLPWRGHNKFVVDKIEYIKDLYQDDNVIDGSSTVPATPEEPAPTDNSTPANSEETISL